MPRSGLRGVPGGYDLAAAPIVLPPMPGESVAGWLSRVAARYDTPVRVILSELLHRTVRTRAPARMLGLLTEDDAGPARALGLSEADLTGWDTPLPVDVALRDYQLAYQGRASVYGFGSSFCPACLAGPDGYWHRAWTNPLVTVCVQHRLLLVQACPSCGQRPFTSSTWTTRAVPIGHCTQRRPGPRRRTRRQHRPLCRAHLTNAPQVRASDEQVAAQALLLALAEHPDTPVTVCGVPTSNTVLFDAILELATDAATRWAPAAMAAPGPAVGAGVVPDITAVSVAATVLAQPTLQEAAALLDEHHLLPPDGVHAPIGPAYRFKARPHNPLLAAAQLTRHRAHLTPAAQLMFRTAAAVPGYPAALTRPPVNHTPASPAQAPRVTGDLAHLTGRFTLTGRPSRYPPPDPSWWPQLLWPGALPTLPAITSPAGDTSRRAGAALAAAKTGSILSWTALTLELGLPPQAVHTATSLCHTARRQHLWPTLLAELEDLTCRLERHPPPIDYRIRRVVGDDLRLLTHALTLAQHDLTATDDDQNPGTDTPSAAAAAAPGLPVKQLLPRFWELFTGGDLAYAPTPIAFDPASDGYQQHRSHTGDLDRAHGAVFHRAHAYLRSIDALTVTGPLTWQPP